MGSEFWLNETDKAMVERVVGNAASAYFAWSASNNVLSEFPLSREDLGVQQSLRKIVEGSDWTYAIYWQVSRSKTGRSALIWGDGHCMEPMEGEGKGEGDNGCKIEKSEDEDDRRWVLRKIHACFGRSDGDDHIAAKSGKVSDLEMFYLTSMYLPFLLDTPSIPSLSFNSGRSVWVSEAIGSLECYESRSYLAKLACFETVVFVPTRLGLVEIGSRRSIPEDMSVIQSAKFIAGKPSLAQTMAAPTIFCREPSVEGSRTGPSLKMEDNSVYSSESSRGGAQTYENSSNGYISETPENGRDKPSNHVEAEREGREKLDQAVVEHKGKQKFWHVKEDVALMASWCLASEENKRGEKGPPLWIRVHKLFNEARAGNPDEIADRTRHSMRSRWKRLNKYGNKWIVAYKKAYGRKTSEMSEKDIEKEAIAIYEEGGGNIQDLVVFNKIMSKHPRWEIKFDNEPKRVARDNEEGNDESGGNSKRLRASEDGEYSTPGKPETPAPSSGCSTIPHENEEGNNDESGGNSKRLRTGEDGEYSIPFKPETPAATPGSGRSTIPRENKEGNDESGGNSKRSRTGEDREYCIPFRPENLAPSSGCPSIPRPTGRDESSSSANEVAAEIRALRVARDKEVERMSKLESARIELELKREERKIMKMNHAMLNTLLGKHHLSPEEEEMKRHLMAIVLRQ